MICVNTASFLFSVERQDERIAEMKREYHALHERHSEVSNKRDNVLAMTSLAK